MKAAEQRLTEKALKKVSAKVIQYIYQTELLADGDHILVGLSGGKDSYLLLELMAECVRRLPFSIKVSAAHVALDNVGYRIDTGYMAELCARLSIPFYLLKDEVDLDNEKKKGMCFVCAWTRRKLIFNLTREIAANKLAFGHHMDDAVQTLLMNQIWHGTISAMPCSLAMLDERIRLIRPMLCLVEEDVTAYTALRDYPASLATCPHDSNTKRQEIRNVLSQIKSMNRAAIRNLFRSMENIFPEYLPQSGKPLKKRNSENLMERQGKE
ncbi:ATP-binding protein [uncultured Acetobacteroides sp.]|uniref:tRNA lysidine(34) synthetase n=1 Tax=uncultured Acetobacteroides sp. TaxID=1760811 RepID=UPI0029F5A95B|nr:ATP-binding protein [uncultured Acetobacteroides sp.]